MIRAVIDPGVLVAGVLSPAGAPAQLLRAWQQGMFDLVVCPMLLDELRRVFSYPRIAARITADEASRLIATMELGAVLVADPDDIRSVCRDPDDDYLFAVASGDADVLVSGDKDVLDAAAPPVRVLTPAGFAEILRRRWT